MNIINVNREKNEIERKLVKKKRTLNKSFKDNFPHTKNYSH